MESIHSIDSQDSVDPPHPSRVAVQTKHIGRRGKLCIPYRLLVPYERGGVYSLETMACESYIFYGFPSKLKLYRVPPPHTGCSTGRALLEENGSLLYVPYTLTPPTVSTHSI